MEKYMDLIRNMPLLLSSPPGSGESGGGAVTLVTFGLVFVVFYFLIIRPQSRRQKNTKEMLGRLSKGDKVVTIGGIRGVVKSITADSVVVKVSGDTTLELNRSAISSVVNGGSSTPAATKTKTTAKKITDDK